MANRRGVFYSLYTVLPECSGVYGFYNTKELKYYIGCSISYKGGMRWRCRDHLYNLRANKHSCAPLQEAWNRDNTCWKFVCLEITDNLEREVYWINLLDTVNFGYNMKSKNINDNRGVNNPMYGRHHSYESKLRISNSKIGIKHKC